MNTNNKSEREEWIYEKVYTLIKEIVKSPAEYNEECRILVGKIAEELEINGLSIEVEYDNPITNMIRNIVQESGDVEGEARAVSRILSQFDELKEAGYEIEADKQVLFYRLYEIDTNQKFDIKDLRTDDIKKLGKYLDWFEQVGKLADFQEYAEFAGKVLSLVVDGDENGVKEEITKFAVKQMSGFVAGQLASMLIAGLAISNPIVAFATLITFGMIGDAIGDVAAEGWSMIFDEIFGLYDQAGAYTYPVDPLILDLDGDGIETISVEDGVNFDFDNNGFAEKTGWVGKDDGLLVRDINGNGQIDNGGELFGDLTAAEDFTAKNGFEALQYFDINGDNVINQLDEIYSELRVWQDTNQNGKVDAGELHSLDELGIAGFDLNYEDINETDSSGNSHTQKSIYIKEDGSVAVLEDVWFGKDAADTIVVDRTQEDLLEETEAISGLPDIRGYGNQYSLHQAMLRDETGELQSLIEQYVATEDTKLRKSMITNIIYVWTGVEDESSTGRGSNLSDSRKLEALEVITGRDFQSAYGSNPVYQAGQYIEQAFNKLVEMYYAELERQTTYADLYQHLYSNMDIDEEGNVFFDTGKVMEVLTAEYEVDARNGRKQILYFVNNIKNTGFINLIDEKIFLEQLALFGGNIIQESDYVGANTLTGTNGNDELYGGEGNDTLSGGYGSDTYIFNLGDGEDVINNYDSSTWWSDRIVFGEGVRAEDMEVYRSGNDLVFQNRISGDRVTVQNAMSDRDGWYYIGSVEFADGTKWDAAYLQENTRHYTGSEGDDVLNGQGWGYNYNQSETFRGEGGNDTLSGGYGSDTYIFNLGDGEDVVVEMGGTDKVIFGEDIDSEDLMFAREGNNLKISVIGQEDSITISNYYYNNNYKVESFQTADGSMLDYTKLDLMIQAMASFEDTTGMMWEDAVQNKNEQANDIINQWWTKE